MSSGVSFDLSSVFRTVAQTLPDREALIWRDQRWTLPRSWTRVSTASRTTSSPRGSAATSSAISWLRMSPARTTSGSTCATATSTWKPWPPATGLASRRSTSTTATSRKNSSICSPTPQRRPWSTVPSSPVRGLHSRSAARTAGAYSGRRRQRQRIAAGRGRLRIDRHHSRTGRRHAHSQRRRPLRPLHRRHHRHAQGRAVASARHLHVGDGRAALRLRHVAGVLRRARRAGSAPTPASARS